MMMMRIRGIAGITGACCALLAGATAAQTVKGADGEPFPSRPLRFVIGFLPGGVSDTIARILSVKLGDEVNQRIVVDGRPGAGGLVAMEITASANPDGYTIYLAQPVVVISRLFRNKPPVDSLKALAPVVFLGTAPTILVVHPSLPVSSVKELIAFAKTKPEGLNFGSSGAGTTNHLAGELLRVTAGIPLTHVPYKGAAASTLAVVQGEIPLAFQPLTGAIPHIKSGRIKGLAVTGAKRTGAVPDLPTMAETLPGYVVEAWYGLVVPAKTPRPVIQFLNQKTNRVLAMPDVIDAFAKNGLDAEGSTPEAFGKFMQEDALRWEKLVKQAGIKFD